MLISCLAYSTLKLEATGSFETSVIFSGLYGVISYTTELLKTYFLILVRNHAISRLRTYCIEVQLHSSVLMFGAWPLIPN
jgi:hypothetical protein